MTASFTFTTLPDTGANSSLTALVDSMTPKDSLRLHRGAHLGQLDVDDGAQRVLRVPGDADDDGVARLLRPLVVLGVLEVARVVGHGVSGWVVQGFL